MKPARENYSNESHIRPRVSTTNYKTALRYKMIKVKKHTPQTSKEITQQKTRQREMIISKTGDTQPLPQGEKLLQSQAKIS